MVGSPRGPQGGRHARGRLVNTLTRAPGSCMLGIYIDVNQAGRA